MKKYFILAAAALAFAACTSDELVPVEQVQQVVDDGTIRFDAYLNRATTRAGQTGVMDLTLLQTSGFGVFSYYTNNEGYSELAKPDFMYNQKVEWGTSAWTYDPVKYWPNEFGQDAASERVDYLTFFAYAPYVLSEPKTGKVATSSTETGIIGMTRNTTIGDPLIKYAVDFNPNNCVDLCYGVAANDFTETVTDELPNNNISAGEPYIDVIKPKTESKIKFNFKHALTQLNVQIDTDVDVESHAGSDANNKTRVFVRSVSFEGFTDKGTLNLHSTESNLIWYDATGNGNLSTTAINVYDGRYDGREGVDNVAAPNELPQGLNPLIVQSKAYITSPSFGTDVADPGVKHEAVNLFNASTADAPILVIPYGQNLKINVVYDVETYDANLSTFLSDGKTHGSTIENAISKEIVISSTPVTLEAGKKYTVKLHLGLTSVKFDAIVSAWTPYASELNGDLPVNAASYYATVGGSTDASIPYYGAAGTFQASGFTANESVTVAALTGVSGTPNAATSTTATTNGIATQAYTIDANNTIHNITGGTLVLTGSGGSATLNISQDAAPLGLKVEAPALVAVNKVITLGATATIATDDFADANWTVVRNRGGVSKTLTKTSTPGDDTYEVAEVSGSPITATITLGANAQAGDVYTITCQAGDAAAETVTVTVPKQAATIAFATPNPSNPSAFTAGNYDLGDDVLTNSASLTDAASAALTADAANGGTIAYTLSDNEYFSITSDGVLKFKAGWNPGDSRTVTVTATVTPGANYSYEAPSVSYTITVATANP